MKLVVALAFATALALPARADPPEIVAVEAREADRGWKFSVTLRHPDTGWDHFADGWEVRAPDGTVLGTRELVHPHVDEQPFTRTLSRVEIPDELDTVVIFARCNQTGWTDGGYTLTLPRE